MRLSEDIIRLAREFTGNQDYTEDASRTTTAGLSQNLIVEFLNEAQDHLQAAIISVYPTEFTAQKEISLTGVEAYSVPDNMFINNKLLMVEYSSTGDSQDYYKLPQRTLIERMTSTSSDPDFYIRRSGQILLNPIPTNSRGKIRVSYYRDLDNIDIRRGVIDAITLTPTAITALSCGITDDYQTELSRAEYVCINDRNGNVKMYNIPVTAYNTSTGDFTIAGGSYTFASGETGATGQYITIGQYSTTHSKLPESCERYLKIYAQKRLLTKDSNNNSIFEDSELKTIEADILANYANASEDIEEIAILDPFMV